VCWTPVPSRLAPARVKQPKFPAAVWRVTDLEPGRSFVWVSESPGVHVTGHHIVEPTAQGSHVTLGVDFRGRLAPLARRLMGGVTERYLALEAAGLKRRSEGD
jgi:hypothetical protein